MRGPESDGAPGSDRHDGRSGATGPHRHDQGAPRSRAPGDPDRRRRGLDEGTAVDPVDDRRRERPSSSGRRGAGADEQPRSGRRRSDPGRGVAEPRDSGAWRAEPRRDHRRDPDRADPTRARERRSRDDVPEIERRSGTGRRSTDRSGTERHGTERHGSEEGRGADRHDATRDPDGPRSGRRRREDRPPEPPVHRRAAPRSEQVADEPDTDSPRRTRHSRPPAAEPGGAASGQTPIARLRRAAASSLPIGPSSAGSTGHGHGHGHGPATPVGRTVRVAIAALAGALCAGDADRPGAVVAIRCRTRSAGRRRTTGAGHESPPRRRATAPRAAATRPARVS